MGTWSGVGIQPTLEVTDSFSVGGRVEYMDDQDRSDRSMTNYTITPTLKLSEAVVIRAELRYDDVNAANTAARPFVDDKGMSKSSATTASVGFSYHFGS